MACSCMSIWTDRIPRHITKFPWASSQPPGLTRSDPTPTARSSTLIYGPTLSDPIPTAGSFILIHGLTLSDPTPAAVHSSWYMDLHYQIPPPLQFIHLDIWTYTTRSHPRCSSFILIYGPTLSDPTPTAGSFILIHGLTLSDPTPAAVHSSWYMDLHYQIPPPLQVHSSWYMDLHYQIPLPLQFIHLDIWTYTTRSHPRCSSFILIYGPILSDPTPAAVHSSWYMDLHYQIPPPLQFIHLDIRTYTIRSQPHCSSFILIYGLTLSDHTPAAVHSSWYMDLHYQIPPPLQFIHLDIWTYTIRSHPRCSSFILIYGLTLSDPTPAAVHSS